ncbi:MAG: hypothetical protein NkDv07_0985 [Candidatus Improbicoccus devescovinae]|nr:MAG: hypothetical protein NkDv07_0985 [Candidatus Improbicoccus devescovinae]
MIYIQNNIIINKYLLKSKLVRPFYVFCSLNLKFCNLILKKNSKYYENFDRNYINFVNHELVFVEKDDSVNKNLEHITELINKLLDIESPTQDVVVQNNTVLRNKILNELHKEIAKSEKNFNNNQVSYLRIISNNQFNKQDLTNVLNAINPAKKKLDSYETYDITKKNVNQIFSLNWVLNQKKFNKKINLNKLSTSSFLNKYLTKNTVITNKFLNNIDVMAPNFKINKSVFDAIYQKNIFNYKEKTGVYEFFKYDKLKLEFVKTDNKNKAIFDDILNKKIVSNKNKFIDSKQKKIYLHQEEKCKVDDINLKIKKKKYQHQNKYKTINLDYINEKFKDVFDIENFSVDSTNLDVNLNKILFKNKINQLTNFIFLKRKQIFKNRILNKIKNKNSFLYSISNTQEDVLKNYDVLRFVHVNKHSKSHDNKNENNKYENFNLTSVFYKKKFYSTRKTYDNKFKKNTKNIRIIDKQIHVFDANEELINIKNVNYIFKKYKFDFIKKSNLKNNDFMFQKIKKNNLHNKIINKNIYIDNSDFSNDYDKINFLFRNHERSMVNNKIINTKITKEKKRTRVYTQKDTETKLITDITRKYKKNSRNLRMPYENIKYLNFVYKKQNSDENKYFLGNIHKIKDNFYYSQEFKSPTIIHKKNIDLSEILQKNRNREEKKHKKYDNNSKSFVNNELKEKLSKPGSSNSKTQNISIRDVEDIVRSYMKNINMKAAMDMAVERVNRNIQLEKYRRGILF